MKYKSFKPLVSFKSIHDGQCFIIADGIWHKVDRMYSVEELELLQEKISYEDISLKHLNVKSYTVNGSKNSTYEVTYMNNVWSCTCPAHSFRKYSDCKHITQIKSTL